MSVYKWYLGILDSTKISYTALLSCQPSVTVTRCFVYKAIRDLESMDHLCINLILCINTKVIYRLALAQVKCIP